jgi:uncharacterized protein YuzE
MVRIPVKLTYDADVDAAYVYLVDAITAGAVTETRLAMLEFDRASIAFDFDADGKILGLEILGASRVLTKETLRHAERSV